MNGELGGADVLVPPANSLPQDSVAMEIASPLGRWSMTEWRIEGLALLEPELLKHDSIARRD